MFLKFSVPRASNVLMLFLFLYRNIQKNARICMNWQFEAEIVLNLFLIFRDFEARCSYKIVLIKKKSVSHEATIKLKDKENKIES